MTCSVSKYRLGVLISGSGSNLQAIIDATKKDTLPEAEVVVVVSSKKSAYGLKRAKDEGIDSIYLPYKEFGISETYDRRIVEVLKSYKVDLVVLAGYLKILGSPLLEAFEDKILNIHPSLLPDFGGVNMYGIKVHEAVLAAKRSYSGCSVHIVTEEVDKGPIIDQISVPVKPDDTPEELARRVLSCEHQLYPRAIKKYIQKLKMEQSV
jgi:phosphoribosylglycinamide formyltransferase-1